MEIWFEYLVDSILAIGALATAGSFIYMLLHQKKQDLRISNLENLQIDSFFRPDIRINSYGNINGISSLTVENNGEEIVVESLSSSKGVLIDEEGIATWFPHSFDKADKMVIPLKSFIDENLRGTIIIIAKDKLLRSFSINIVCDNGKFSVLTPKQL